MKTTQKFLKTAITFWEKKYHHRRIQASGLILDIGDGDDGVIGHLNSDQVIAIATKNRELW